MESTDHTNKLLEILRELIAVKTENPPGNEKALADRLQSFFGSYSIATAVDTVKQGRANLLVRIEGDHPGPVLAFNGHLDTVPVSDQWSFDPYKCSIAGGRLVGLGSTDMKAGLAAMALAAIKANERRNRMHGVLSLVFVADEERTNLGTKDFLARYERPDYVVIGEPTNLDLVTSNRGTLRLKLKTHGLAAHSSNPAAGVNAIYAMVKAVSQLEVLASTLSQDKGHYTEKPSLAVTQISGGAAENIIPDTCEIILDRRLVSGENIETVERQLVEILEQIQQGEADFNITWERIGSTVPWRLQAGSNLLEICRKVYRECFGTEAECRDLGGTSEAGFFADSGIDTILFGPGNIAQAHTRDEYVEIDQVEKAFKYYSALINEILIK